ncbi:MAG: hypothetical protein IIW54_11545 [Lachnospiraceae bacterium]|nr:hypothetical protein [Lachnospiraceae bacterium]
MKKHKKNNSCKSKEKNHPVCVSNEPVCAEKEVVEDTACNCEDNVKISGKVMYRNQGVHLATVTVIKNRSIVAECLTDCDGCYEFKGERGNYILRAHKNHFRSRSRNVNKSSLGSVIINFNLM